MAINDLSNREQLIYDYMKTLLRSTFPNLDLSDDGAFMETFGLPHLKLLEPLMNFADRIRLMQSLENAELMTDDEMDEVAAEYGFRRNPGKRATGVPTLIFRDIPDANVLILNSGDVATSKSALRFLSRDNTVIDETQLGNFYDPDTFTFRIPVTFIAENVGAQYNIAPGELSDMETSLEFFDGIANDAAFSGGEDREDNVSLANRIKEGAGAPTFGVVRGYKRFIRENFPDVIDILVAGYGHPLMTRDIIGTIEIPGFTQSVTDVHWGTKVDLYIRGRTFQDFKENIVVDVMPGTLDLGAKMSQLPVYDIKSISIVSNDPNADPAQLVITDYALVKNEDPETVGTVHEKAYARIMDSRVEVGTTVQVSYRYNALIKNIHNLMYNGDDRPPTADVLAKEANEKFVFASILGKQMSSLRLTESDKSAIRERAFKQIASLRMGKEVQFSDINEAMLQDDSGRVLDYIHQPAHYLVLENNNRLLYYCLSEVERTIFEAAADRNPYTQTMLNAFKDNLTVFDFFDVLHVLLFENGLEKALTGLSAQTGWFERVQRFTMARDIATKGRLLTMLSPATKQVQENEYFSLGQLAVYEDKDYVRDDWANLIALFESLAQTDPDDESDLSIASLTSFCIMLAYIVSNQAELVADTTPLFAYMQRTVRNTLIQDVFNL